MLMKNVSAVEDIKELCEQATNDNHRNAENYEYNKMKKRWHEYVQFNVLEDEGVPVAMGGIIKFNDKTVRICDRYCTFRSHRRFGINKFIKKNIRFCAEHFVPAQTEWALQNNFQPFISMSAEVDKTYSMKRFIEYLDPSYGYRLLPDLYLTCNRQSLKCHQHIITNSDKILLKKV
jgi:hypothetical protein